MLLVRGEGRLTMPQAVFAELMKIRMACIKSIGRSQNVTILQQNLSLDMIIIQ